MPALSQLALFAKNYRQAPAPGVELIVTPRYQVQIVPDFPIPGPNHAAWIRCEAAQADAVIGEVKAIFSARGLPFSWTLDPDTRPPDFADRLRARDFMPQPGGEEAAVMILPATARLEPTQLPGLEIRDALADLAAFSASEQVAAEAFGGVPFGDPTPLDGLREKRFANHRATPGRRVVLATVDGEPAGTSSLTLFAPDGAMANGGSVRLRFRGKGVYRAMVAARMAMARQAGAAGLFVWGGHMSAPILTRLGFETVSWRRFYVQV